jgi:hypothetical protein
MQLKCTAQDVVRTEHISFELGKKNYDDLRGTDLLVPRILVVIVIPEQAEEWLEQTEENLVMRRCGYWFSLRSYGETENLTSITLYIPRTNIFTVEVLRNLMTMIGRGDAP